MGPEVDEMTSLTSEELRDMFGNKAASSFFRPVEDDQQSTENWLQWCIQNKNVKVIECDVPQGILPPHLSAKLTDVKVFTRGPDDALYNKSPEIREKVARGNTLLSLNNSTSNEKKLEMVIFALRKFTGGMGDEDENQPENETVWKRYFLKPFEEAKQIVVTHKENGEAAHLSVRNIEGKFYFIGGSKNVHLMFRTKEDIDKYTESRFEIAKIVCRSILDLLDSIASEKKTKLLSVLNLTKMTAVMEILQPDYQHVVNLSYLKKPTLKFLCFTETYKSSSEANSSSLTYLPPNLALDLGSELGLNCTKYEVIPVSNFEDKMKEVRRGVGYEGCVFYFLDQDGNTIGLLKKKTCWYVLLRAIREKISYAVTEFNKNPGGFKDAARTKNRQKIEKRIGEIQRWLGLSDEEVNHWKNLGTKYLFWIFSKVSEKRNADYGNRAKFPLHWKEFLSESGLSENLSECEKNSGDAEENMEVDDGVTLTPVGDSSLKIKLPESLPDHVNVCACIFRNVDLAGKNMKKCDQIKERIFQKTLKKSGHVFLLNLDKLSSNLEVKLLSEKQISDEVESTVELNECDKLPVLFVGEQIVASAVETKDEFKVDDETSQVLAIILAQTKEQGQSSVKTLIQQFYHSGIGSRFRAGKAIHVEQVAILSEDGSLESYPESLSFLAS